MSIYDAIAQGGKVANIPQAIGNGIKLADMFRQNRIGNATEQDQIDNSALKLEANKQAIDSNKLEQDVNKWSTVGTVMNGLSQLNPSEQDAVYQQIKPQLSSIMGGDLPEKYDPVFAKGLSAFAEQKAQGAQFAVANGIMYNNRTGEYVQLPKSEEDSNKGDFTLGNTRYDKNGNIIVSAPDKPKTPPASVMKLQQENLNDLSISSSIQNDMGVFIDQIDNGKLNLNLMSNLINKARNYSNLSTEESSNLASFQNSLNKLRNDSLRLNKGTQTEKDAERAWDELINNINDSNLVRDRLIEIQGINKRATLLKQMQTDQLREQYGLEPLDYKKYENIESPIGAKSLPSKNGKGWLLHTDAQGNKAYVSPDGKQFEQVTP